MKKEPPPEHTGRVIAVAVVFFGGLAALGYARGVFERLSGGTLLALALFAVGFATLTWLVDAPLRETLKRAFRKAPGTRPSALPAAPSAPRTSARSASAARVRAAG